MSRWNLSWLLGITAVTLLGLSLSHSAPSRSGALEKKHENVRLLVDVLEEVQQKYVKELDSDKMRMLVEDMINNGLEKLDPHSNFINAEEYRQFQQQSRGRFGGVGIRIERDLRTDQIIVESPIPGTPAYEAGVQAGDIIVKIDGKPTEGMATRKVVELIQGEPGEKVTLTVLHEGEKKPVDLEITRAEIHIDSVMSDQRQKNNLAEWDFWVDPLSKIAYLRLVAFTETTMVELTKVVQSLERQGMRGLIIDLRNNPGGLLRSAVEVSSLFVEEGKRIVSTKGRKQEDQIYNSKLPGGIRPMTNLPIAVLINRYSASASEIVAAALQDYFRAVIIGERSYGKGSVQNVILLENGTSALKLTTASYWRPSGNNIHRFSPAWQEDDKEEWGVRPSPGFEVKLSDEERINYFKWRRQRDVVRRDGTPKKLDEKLKDFKDRVLEKGVEYIRGELKKADKANAAAPPQQFHGIEAAPILQAASLSPGRGSIREALIHLGRRQLDEKASQAFDHHVHQAAALLGGGSSRIA
jgi:carboxyl-terminal processing protease